MNQLMLLLLGMTASPVVADAADTLRFVAGEAVGDERFGGEGPVLLAAGIVTIIGIFVILFLAKRQHDAVSERLDVIETVLSEGAPADDR